MGGWADHIFKGLRHGDFSANYFVKSNITRNVLAVTGACMAISKEKFLKLGGFDEEFVICGSDVEICLRAFKAGYLNVLCAQARLYHYESKTRSPHVPDGDFKQSDIKYAPYRVSQTDPFYNPNLSLSSTTPKLNFALNDLT